MPLYEYQCLPESHRFEVRHGINESVDTCQVCGGEVRRVIHPVGIVFKGSGFYATDSRSSPKTSKPDEKPAEKPAASTDSSGTTSSKSSDSGESAASKPKS